MRAFMIGRFQPFHNGHLQVIGAIAEENDQIIIGIGSAQVSHTIDNPFTAGERYLMVYGAINDRGIKNAHPIPIVDINRYGVWVAHVLNLIPPIDVVYSNNPLVKRLFSEQKFEVREMPLFEREHYSGTEIRRRIIANESWQDLVPRRVARVIEEINGVERLRAIAQTDVGSGKYLSASSGTFELI